MRLPNDKQHLTLYGKNGTGKTVAGLWHLEKRSWLSQPWILFDFKRDPTIAQIPRVEEIDIRGKPPRQAGLYVTRPMPGDDVEVTQFLWRVWDQEKTGLFADEAYMMGRFNKAYNGILTQGRSKRIPIIACTQRPSWLSPFQMSESNFHQVFHLQKPEDLKALLEWIPGLRLPTRQNFHSQYYDDTKGELTILKPVPDEDEILNRFDLKMPRRVSHLRGILTTPGGRERKHA